MRKALTAKFVESATCPPGKERAYFWDASLPGFGLAVTASGSRSWVFQYRHAGKSSRMTLKGFPTLAEARKQAHEWRVRLNKGESPSAKPLGANTFADIAQKYLRLEGGKLRSGALYARTLERLVLPEIGSADISAIRRGRLTELFDDISDQNGEVMADLTFAIVRRVMSWHESRDDLFRSPIARGMRRARTAERARKRILSDDELRCIWGATGQPDPFNSYVRFLLLTAGRRNEARQMPWAEVHKGAWTIPGARYKTRRDHVVPLSNAALGVLESLPRIGPARYVFTLNGVNPLGGVSALKAKLDRESGVSDWTLHDLRRTARSLLSRIGVSADTAERCLGHALAGVRATYDRHEYFDEKKSAFEALAALIDRIVTPRDNVVALTARTAG